MLRALEMPPAPPGFKYDLSKNPPILVKKPARQESKRTEALGTKNSLVGKPTDEEQVDLLRCTYDNPISTDETYHVPQRYTYIPKAA